MTNLGNLLQYAVSCPCHCDFVLEWGFRTCSLFSSACPLPYSTITESFLKKSVFTLLTQEITSCLWLRDAAQTVLIWRFWKKQIQFQQVWTVMNFTDWKGNLILRLKHIFKHELQDTVLSRPLGMGPLGPASEGHGGQCEGLCWIFGVVEGQSINTASQFWA